MARFLIALVLALQLAFTMSAEAPVKATSGLAANKSTASANDIFSGMVTASTPDAVTVVRKVPARADEYKVFVVDRDTKIEGKLKVSARVSVHFKVADDGVVHALRIIVRTEPKTSGGAGKAQTQLPTR